MAQSIVQKLYEKLVRSFGFNGSLRVVNKRYVAINRSWSEKCDLGPLSYGLEAAFEKAAAELPLSFCDAAFYGLEG